MKALRRVLKVVNIGLQGFANNITAAGGQVTNITWRRRRAPTRPWAGRWPPSSAIRGSRRPTASPTTGIWPHSLGWSTWCGRGEAIAGLGPGSAASCTRAADRLAGHVRTAAGAIAGAILYEGWADDLEAAEKLAESGAVALEPCHEHSAVGPMAGIISPSMPVWVVENTAAGNRAYCNLNEGLGKVLRFGANSRRCWTGCGGWAATSSRPCRSPSAG